MPTHYETAIRRSERSRLSTDVLLRRLGHPAGTWFLRNATWVVATSSNSAPV